MQFHPEVDLTKNGVEILSNFCSVAQCKRDYTDTYRDEKAIEEIRSTVGSNGKILVLVSGGVDSSVLAALCFKAVGEDRVKCIHIDNGFMRKGKLGFFSKIYSIIRRIGRSGEKPKIGWDSMRVG